MISSISTLQFNSNQEVLLEDAQSTSLGSTYYQEIQLQVQTLVCSLSLWLDNLFMVCSLHTQFVIFFKASALWADAFYKSICPSVCLSVCLSVRLFTFEVPFNGLFAPTSRRRMSNIFRDSESLGKSKSIFFYFLAEFGLQNMVETTLPDGLETSGRRVYR